MIEPVSTGTGILKGGFSSILGLLGLSVFWTDFESIVKILLAFVSLLSALFFLGSAIYDRHFSKKPKKKDKQ